MSYRMIVWASAQRIHSAYQRAVLVELARHHHHKTGRTFPSVATLAENSGCGRKAVMKALRELEELGYISAERAHGRSTRYVFHVKESGPSQGPVSETDHLGEIDESGPLEGLVPERDQSLSGTEVVPQRDRSGPLEGHDSWNDSKQDSESCARARASSPKGGHFAPVGFLPDGEFHQRHRASNPDADFDEELRRFLAYEFDSDTNDWQRRWRRWWTRARPCPVAAAKRFREEWANEGGMADHG